jgi:hypothetical protein
MAGLRRPLSSLAPRGRTRRSSGASGDNAAGVPLNFNVSQL